MGSPREVIDVVVASKDRPDLFARAAASVEAQEIAYRGCLVQNGLDDETVEEAERLGWRVLTTGANQSFSRSMNWGIESGRSERVLLLNNDAVLEPGCVASMMEHSEQVVGCLILHSNGTVNHAGVVVNGTAPEHIGRGDHAGGWGHCERVEAVTFAVALVRRDAWEDVGGFDEQYWYGYEDTDLCLAVRSRGGQIAVCRRARAIHDEFGTRTRENDYVNYLRFSRKWRQRLPLHEDVTHNERVHA